jgi:hypothetical protein
MVEVVGLGGVGSKFDGRRKLDEGNGCIECDVV